MRAEHLLRAAAPRPAGACGRRGAAAGAAEPPVRAPVCPVGAPGETPGGHCAGRQTTGQAVAEAPLPVREGLVLRDSVRCQLREQQRGALETENHLLKREQLCGSVQGGGGAPAGERPASGAHRAPGRKVQGAAGDPLAADEYPVPQRAHSAAAEPGTESFPQQRARERRELCRHSTSSAESRRRRLRCSRPQRLQATRAPVM